MRYAIVDAANKVINSIMLDDIGAWQPPVGSRIIASPDAGPGWTFNGLTFVPPPVVPLTSEQQAAVDTREAKATRQVLMDAQSDQADFFNRVQTSTPAQIDNWIDTNVTSLTAARAVLKAIIKYLAKAA